MRKLTHSEYCNQLKNRSIFPVEEYQGAYQKIKHRCLVCEHIWSVTPKSMKNNNGCPRCYQLSVRKPLNIVQNQLQKYGWEIIDSNSYINSYHRIKFKHICGNIITSNVDLLTRNVRKCKNCNPTKIKKHWSMPATTNNRTYSSKIEMQCCEYLIEKFGLNDIILQKIYPGETRKTADAYIISLDCYVEVSTINKEFYLNRIFEKRKKVKNFIFVSTLDQLKIHF